jgi:hypothetical protein
MTEDAYRKRARGGVRLGTGSRGLAEAMGGERSAS